MNERKNWTRRIILCGLLMAVAILLCDALPVFAQGTTPPPGVPEVPLPASYFSRFLMIKEKTGGVESVSLVGTSLVWFCLCSSVAIISMIIQNGLQTRQSVYMPKPLVDSLEQMIADKQYKEAMELTEDDKSPFGQIMAAAMHEAPRGYVAMEMAIEEKADELNNRRVRNLVWLEIAGAAGPMIGLFGTVFGMINAFFSMLGSGGAPKAAELAGGIATALVCTFWGLVVGIPGVISASLFKVKVEGLTAEAILTAKRLIAPFRPGAGGKKASGSPAPAVGPATPKPVAT